MITKVNNSVQICLQAFNQEETLSISSQLMNRNNYLVILEEIIKGRNLSRKKLPPHFNTLMPPDQVRISTHLCPLIR